MEEKKAHDLIKDLLQKIWDEHKLCITDISIDWFKTSTAKPYVYELKIQSKTDY